MFDLLKPLVSGFPNYVSDDFAVVAHVVSPEEMFLDRVNLKTLTAPEWAVLIAGARVLNLDWDGAKHGDFTDKVGVLRRRYVFEANTKRIVQRKGALEFSLSPQATMPPPPKVVADTAWFRRPKFRPPK